MLVGGSACPHFQWCFPPVGRSLAVPLAPVVCGLRLRANSEIFGPDAASLRVIYIAIAVRME